jgi:hypothetical protein
VETHAKDHFRRLVGTKLAQFEGHLAEIMWRATERGNIYEEFFRLLKSVYPLDGPAQYTYPTPLFNTWEGIPESQSKLDDWEIRPGKKKKRPKKLQFLKHSFSCHTGLNISKIFF